MVKIEIETPLKLAKKYGLEVHEGKKFSRQELEAELRAIGVLQGYE